ncbi:hypothetical protein [Brachybacterium fresconis]|uniref:Membrane protein n=1 Tax=Brachybacterium fresconis TaxID=173363 RepID=A0ABS4YQ08_9MICO|nr:hypothetical protein [Brachybacterium fresconis]MBP2410555.1 putative membrane protein [Brachybacterium fresconis]
MTVPPPPHDPYGQPSPAPGAGHDGQPSPAQPGAYGQPSPADQYGQSAPGGQYGQPSPSAGYGAGNPPAPAGQDAWGQQAPTGQDAWGQQAPTAAPAVGPPPGTDLASDLGAALKFAGNSLLRNPAAFIIAGLIYSVVMFVLVAGGSVLGFVLTIPQMEATASSDDPPIGALLTLYGIIIAASLLCIPLSLLWQSGSARAAGVILEGGRPSIGQAMIGPMRIILTALLVLVITFIGFLLLYIPGIIASVLLMYAVPAAVRGASPVEAVKESFSLVTKNLGTSIVMVLALAVIGSVAGLIVISVIVLIPFTMLAYVGMYERLSGRDLPEPARG